MQGAGNCRSLEAHVLRRAMTTVAELQELIQRAVLVKTRRAFFQDLADRHDVVRGVGANILGRAAPPLVPVVIETTAEQRLGGTVLSASATRSTRLRDQVQVFSSARSQDV